MGYRVRGRRVSRRSIVPYDLKVGWIPEISKLYTLENWIFYDRIFTMLFKVLIINIAIIRINKINMDKILCFVSGTGIDAGWDDINYQ